MFQPRMILLLTMLICLLPALASASSTKAAPIPFKPGQFLILSYHAVTLNARAGDKYTITRGQFTEQMEYLKTHAYHPVSFQDVLDAKDGKTTLPAKAVLLTFDDAYFSYYDFVAPLLKQYGFPSMLAVIGSFIDQPPNKGLPEKLMTWKQINEVASSPLIEIASHTYGLHKAIQYNPIGNVGAAVNVRQYFPEQQRYETEAQYRNRLTTDFIRQNRLLEKKIGFKPRVIIWPFGKHNAISWNVAKDAGYHMGLTLEWGLADLKNLAMAPRVMVESTPIKTFIESILYPNHESTIVRAVQVDLDLIYDDSIKQMDKNLGKLIDRLHAMKVNRVYLQAFADPDGDGNVDSVYFHNRFLPVRVDFFSHAAHQLMIRGVEVYAWMPSMSLIFPDQDFNEKYRVQEKAKGEIRPSHSWYQRLTPFSHNVRQRVGELYKDLAAYNQIDGILFQDDAYLTDREDFHPLAMAAYKNAYGRSFIPQNDTEDPAAAKKWGEYKTLVLIDYIKGLIREVRRMRPEAKFARNIYASLLTDPQSEAWFAQNYQAFLSSYDEVVIMAYPQMENASDPSVWLNQLVDKARTFKGLKKTVFKLQAYDWKKERWLESELLLEEMRDLLVAGGIHLAYYPDNVYKNRPLLSEIKLEMSRENFPLAR